MHKTKATKITFILDKIPNSLADTFINIAGEPAASFRYKLANIFFENMMKFKHLSTVTHQNGTCNIGKTE